MTRSSKGSRSWKGGRSAVLLTGGVLAGLTLAACGGQSPATESSQARATLVADVKVIRYCAVAHQRQAAEQALARLRHDVARLEAAGQMNQAAASKVLAAARAVENDLSLLGPAATSTTSTTTATTTTTLPPTTVAPTTMAPTTVPPTTKPPAGPPPGGPPGHHHGHGGGDGGGGQGDGG